MKHYHFSALTTRKGLTGAAIGLSAFASLFLVGCSPEATPPVSGGTKAQAADSNTITLFVPCGMVDPMMKVRKKFEALPDKPTVKIINDNAVILMRRIRRGEYTDILFSPGETEMNLMVKEDYIERKEVQTFGSFKLILVVPYANRAKIKQVSDLTASRVKRIAIADPAQNSVGYYAEEALKSLGMWDAVKPKLVSHWHALEAVTYVCKDRVDVGIYFNSCPFESTPSELSGYENSYRILETLPESSYPPIKVQAGVLKKSNNPELARKFIQYLLQPDTQKLLKASGIPNVPTSGKEEAS
ncbi:MAG: molybdate ABC transporter substrate-binding protein [Armatimonadetes bacterium]|nr:molybdate ABC transporter substrate-binding protein [Armatimonadota bacterium]